MVLHDQLAISGHLVIPANLDRVGGFRLFLFIEDHDVMVVARTVFDLAAK